MISPVSTATIALVVSGVSAVVAVAAWREVRVAEKKRALDRIGEALAELVDARRNETELRPFRMRLLVLVSAFGHRDDLPKAWAVAETPWNHPADPDAVAAAVQETTEFRGRFRPLL